ncbi:MAG TPA: DUF349 domain-containing protein, partial [Steroidobacteraceae bacterium]|nr:DUF349 domain-containing protein [Steroidobacteraceae bacterium]
DSGPSERAATKPLEKTFDALISKIQARLDAEYAANLERKQSLVQQAQRLAAIEDAVQASNEVKRLQNAWREVGLTHHAEGQRLWEEFKQLCDGVFNKRRLQHTERMTELKQTEAQAIALCEETEQLSKRTGAELYSSAARIRELREAFNNLGELPRESTQRVERRFGRALEDFERAVGQQRKREAEGAWDNLFEAANRVRVHQLEGSVSAPELRAHLDGIQHWPKGGAQAIEKKLSQTATASTTASEAALRELAIRAEIASGQPTPADDQMQRRTMQLQALVNGTGRTTASMKEQLEALAFEWLAARPVASPLYEELFARFRRAWEASR